MQNKDFDYVGQAVLTASPQFNGTLVPRAYMVESLSVAVDALNRLDAIKKALFYGRPLDIVQVGPEQVENCEALAIEAGSGHFETGRDVIHGIIGKATESGELLEVILSLMLEHKAIDTVNVAEEVGDGQWYDALIANATGISFEELQLKNIAKLRARYPDRFTAYDAENRNLANERRILEDRQRKGNEWPFPTGDKGEGMEKLVVQLRAARDEAPEEKAVESEARQSITQKVGEELKKKGLTP